MKKHIHINSVNQSKWQSNNRNVGKINKQKIERTFRVATHIHNILHTQTHTSKRLPSTDMSLETHSHCKNIQFSIKSRLRICTSLLSYWWFMHWITDSFLRKQIEKVAYVFAWFTEFQFICFWSQGDSLKALNFLVFSRLRLRFHFSIDNS